MTEKEMRMKQYMTALASSKSAIERRDYENARYWLDSAMLVLDAMHRESQRWPSSDMDLIEIRGAGY